MQLDRKQVLATVVPIVVVAIGVLVKWIETPNAVRDLFRSGRAFAVVVVVAVLWLALMWALWRFTNVWVRGAVMTVVSIVLAVALVVPSLRDTVVREKRAGFDEVRVDPDDTTTTTMAPATETAPSTTTTAPPTTPVQVSTGTMVGIDHDATGTANVFRNPDGTYTVELFEIDVEPGPDYFVYVVPGAGREGTDGGTDLGALKGNVGTQYYDVPAGIDVTGEWTVLIWCRVFAVPIGNATQIPV